MPNKPRGPLKVSDVNAEGCKLKWEPPEDDGGSPVEYYNVERMDVETGHWIPVATTKTPQTDVSIVLLFTAQVKILIIYFPLLIYACPAVSRTGALENKINCFYLKSRNISMLDA